ncbi:hypothetical protein ES707_06792 [subsurface metagenome]
MQKQVLKIFLVILPLIPCIGCAPAKVIGILTTPAPSETKIKAEYNIAKLTTGRIIVLVDQAVWAEAETNFRPYLTEAINLQLSKRAKLKDEFLVSYSQLSRFRSARPDFEMLSPAELGTAFGAEKVLVVAIEDYELYELAGSGYYKGSLDTRSFLFDVQTGRMLWPSSAKGKAVSISLDSARDDDDDAAAKLLAKTSAHCIVRYFYDCPKNKFKTWGERIREDIKHW